MLFSERDIDVLRLLCWCQYISPEDMGKLLTDVEQTNLMLMGFMRQHKKSTAFALTSRGRSFLEKVLNGAVPDLAQSYHEDAIQRRLRLAKMILASYQGGIDPFTTTPEDLRCSPSLFLSTVTRGRGSNPWGSTRIAAIAHLGDLICAMHYVCSGIGKLALIDELAAFSNQTARFRDAKRAFIFAGESYSDILTELEASVSKADGKLISYGDAYRCSQLPVYLLSCDDIGAVQLQIMAAPDYRRRLSKAALKSLYQPPLNPAWDALFQGIPFVMAADMDLRRIDAAVLAARQEGFRKIAIAALEGQAQEVLFSRYRDTGKARVFILTGEAISEATGKPPVPYVPPRTQFLTEEGDVIDAPTLQAPGRTGR